MTDMLRAYLFFGYGLTLFAMGLAIVLETRRASELPLAKSLWWLAGFGFLHSLVEWLEMLWVMGHRGLGFIDREFPPAIVIVLLVVSGFLFAQFGASLLASSATRLRWIRLAPLSLLPLWLLMMWLAAGGYWFGEGWTRLATVTARYAFYVPGAAFCGLALLYQRPIFRAAGLPRLARDCTLGAAVFVFKGVVAGLLVPSAPFFPANLLNYSSFQDVVSVPPEIFRALAAVGITYFVLRVLRRFELRRKQEMEFVSHQLKRLSIQTFHAQEEERKRIARELHDDTAQLLSSLLLRLKMLDRAKTMDEVRDKTQHIVDLATQTSDGVRRLAFELRPAALEDLGLDAAIRWYSEEIAAPRGLTVEVQSTGLRDRLPSQVELGVYRVVQEALTNVAKHSGGHKASVKLERTNGNVTILVEDDGCGFDVGEVTSSRERGLGLFGMRERVSLLGGKLRIDSGPKRGTRVTVEVPITEKAG